MSAEFIPFRHVPEWDDNEQFTITGKQLRAVQELFKAYTPFVNALEPVFVENLDNGKIKMRYEDTNGNPLQKEDIEAMLERYAQSIASAIDSKTE